MSLQVCCHYLASVGRVSASRGSRIWQLSVFLLVLLCGLGNRNAQAETSSSTPTPAAALTMSANLPSGHIGVLYSGSISASGGSSPYKFAVVDGSLPPGLALDSSSGAITGIPTKW